GVLGKQNSVNETCVRDAGTGSLVGLTVTECLAADTRSRVSKAIGKLVKKETKKCMGDPSRLPEFGYPGDGVTSVATLISEAGLDQSLGMLEDLFGSDLDDVIITAGAGQKCQADTLKRTNDVLEKMVDQAIRGKDAGLKNGSVLSTPELAQAITDAIDQDDKGRIAKEVTQLGEKVEMNCATPGVDLASAFPGQCSGSIGATAFASCLELRARCRACLALDAIDELSADCDGFDDGINDNLSCVPSAP
ncbi:MAG: hypothetical protein V3T14_11485, partial [Myxococcota bacterium]